LRKEIYIAGGASVLAFVLSTPVAILDLPNLLAGLNQVASAESSHPGIEGNTWSWYASYLLEREGIFVALGVLQMTKILFTRYKRGIVLVSFPCIYYLFINQLAVRVDRTVMPVVPFFALLTGLLLVQLYDRFAQSTLSAVAPVILGLATVLVIFPSLKSTVDADTNLLKIDGRETARQWLEANLADGTRVAVESYSPYLNTKRFTIEGVGAIVDHSPDWYIRNGFEYLVFSQGMYQRFFNDPSRYQLWVDKYSHAFATFPEIRRFNDSGYEIRILKTGVALPTKRMAARYGDYGDLIELVGYETLHVDSGSMLVEFYWRPLRASPEPLELETRVLASHDQEVAKVRADLFEGMGWQDHLFSVDWLIPLAKDTTAGPYRLQLTVVQTRYSYSVPAKSWTGEDITPVILGPFEIR
jgi:hypothetical protein